MEWLLLENVEWRIRVPNALTFLRHFHHGLAHCPSSRGVVPNDPAGASAFKAIANFLAVGLTLNSRLGARRDVWYCPAYISGML